VTTSGDIAQQTDGIVQQSGFVPAPDGAIGGDLSVDTTGADLSAKATDPTSGISLAARGAAALCLLSSTLASTDPGARPLATATLSTLCEGNPSTVDGGGTANIPGVASGTIDANAAICLIANAVGVPSKDLASGDPSSGGATLNPVATATIRAACDSASDKGPGEDPTPDTLTSNGTVDVPNVGPTTFDAAAAVCLLGVASGGIPTTASVSTLCGVEPSEVNSPDNSTKIRDLTEITPTGNASACLIANATVDVPTSATAGTACPGEVLPGGTPSGSTPSTGDITGSGDLPGTMPDATLSAAVCLVATAVAGPNPSLNVADACAAPSGGGNTPPGGEPSGGGEPAAGTVPEGPVTVAGSENPPSQAAAGGTQPAGLPAGFAQLPSTSTSAGVGVLALAALAGLAAIRRRMK